MVNTRSKGNRIKRKAIDYYRDKGWIVDTVELTGKFRKSKDLFSAYCLECDETISNDEIDDHPHKLFPGFDLIGVKPGRIVLIQVKTNSPPTRKPYIRFAERFAGQNVWIQSYTWYDYKGARIQKYFKNGNVGERDLRD